MSEHLPVPPPAPGLRPDPSRQAVVRSLRLLARAACGRVPGNRRSEIRRTLRFACRVRRTDGARLVGDRAIDLSPQGMLVLSDERLKIEADLHVSFMPLDLPIWFDSRARVARIVEGRRSGDVGRALGLRFESLPVVSRLILRGQLQKIPPTAPEREVPADLLVKANDPDYARIVRDILGDG